jgi:hypothetical protein
MRPSPRSERTGKTIHWNRLRAVSVAVACLALPVPAFAGEPPRFCDEESIANGDECERDLGSAGGASVVRIAWARNARLPPWRTDHSASSRATWR